jgi:hypothetical protein
MNIVLVRRLILLCPYLPVILLDETLIISVLPLQFLMWLKPCQNCLLSWNIYIRSLWNVRDLNACMRHEKCSHSYVSCRPDITSPVKLRDALQMNELLSLYYYTKNCYKAMHTSHQFLVTRRICYISESSITDSHCPDDRGRKFLWNVSKLLTDYTALQPKRQPSSFSPPWEPQILLNTKKSNICCCESVINKQILTCPS